MRLWIGLCVCLGLITASCGRSDAPTASSESNSPPTRVATETAWTEFTSTVDGFAVSFPTPPETQTQDNQYDFGTVTIRAYTSNPRQNVVWRVATHSYPEGFASRMGPKKLLTTMRDGMAKNVSGKPEDIGDIILDGHPGQEFRVRSTDPLTSKPLTIRVRLYVVEDRVHQVSLIAPPNDASLGEEASQFFKSFRLVTD